MKRRRHPKPSDSRRGVILLVVLSLLALFLVVGLSFVSYADSEMLAARSVRDGETVYVPDVDMDQALAYFMNQLIYGVIDDETGAYSGVRGHDLARNMYGSYYEIGQPSNIFPAIVAQPNQVVPGLNTTPFNGTGRLHGPTPFGAGFDEYYLPNYTYFPADGIGMHDPERWSGSTTTAPSAWRPGLRLANGTPIPRGMFTGGFNAPYTYQDQNSMFLAMVDNQGVVQVPSFFRNIPSPLGFGSLDPTNPNWTDTDPTHAYLKYMVLSPRPADHPAMLVNGVLKAGFPLPEDAGGYVKNLLDAPGGNDSIWIDIGSPVMKLPDGRKYKMLVAPLILDLDSRVNLNVAGNIRGTNNGQPTHVSNQGWGKWEMNPGWVLSANAAEYKNLFQGNTTTGLSGRYGLGPTGLPAGVLVPTRWPGAPPAETSPFYSLADLDACNDGQGGLVTSFLQLPPFPSLGPTLGPPIVSSDPAKSFTCFPRFPNGYSAGFGELQNSHPSIYNYFFPQGTNRVFGASHMEAILRYGHTNSPALTSDLYRLLPNNLAWGGSPTAPNLQLAAQIRRWITTISMDQDRPGMTPYVWDPAAATKFTWAPPIPPSFPPPAAGSYPVGQPIAFPQLTQRQPVTPGTNPPAGSDFDPYTWRAEPTTFRNIANVLKRIDLDRKLTDFPTTTNGAMPAGATAQVAQAVLDRQNFAADIFNGLLAVTGCQNPNGLPAPVLSAADLNAARWLAQLAANIVDFIDNDDYSTPFAWHVDLSTNPPTPLDWVFGTEVPRIVMNESFVEYDNLATDTSPVATGYNVNVWVELHNTARTQAASAGYMNIYPPAGMPANYPPLICDDGTAWLQVGTNAAYQIVLCDKPDTAATNLANPANSTGDPDFGVAAGTTVRTNVTSWGAGVQQTIAPAYGQYSGTQGSNQGFYVVGPQTTYNKASLGDPGLPSTFTTPQMTFVEPVVPPATGRPFKLPMILLRRLAIPSLPPNPPDPITGKFTGIPNPYITIDCLYHKEAGLVKDAEVNDGTTFDNSLISPYPATQIPSRASFGRNQPYAARFDQWTRQAPNPALLTMPQNTFFRHNSKSPTEPASPLLNETIRLPFDWPVHLDRQLISPMELLQVSGYRPHEYTQQFMIGAANTPLTRFRHTAPWFDQTARIYRFLEFVESSDKAASCTVGGRLPGKININTVWPDMPGGPSSVFRALCDPQLSNNFDGRNLNPPQGQTAIVDAMFQTLAAHRTPTGVPALGDKPLLGMTAGYSVGGPPFGTDQQYPSGNGINWTLLTTRSTTSGSSPEDPRILQVPGATDLTNPQLYHPYQQDALLTKIFSNVTTRSNVFAVWMTVGFFEVNDDTTRPVKLGAELNRAENRQVRHRMFAIVDRTALTWFNTTAQAAVTIPTGQNSAPLTMTIPAGAPIDPRTGRPWTIVPGMVLNVDFGGVDPITGQYAEENVVVLANPPPVAPTATTAGSFTATFTKSHSANAPIKCYGNPGPWTRYDPRQDNQVVPYFSIID